MLAPLFAPVFGSYVAAWLGWRPLSGVLALFVIGCLAMVAAKLPKTLPRAERSKGGVARAVGSYAAVLSHRLSLACSSAAEPRSPGCSRTSPHRRSCT
jgi:DHA1 family bicyclomycin/chloramphenicol resistance-like MFS transporter